MSSPCIREELHVIPDFDVGDILLCTSKEKKDYHNHLFRCLSFKKDNTFDYTIVEIIYNLKTASKGSVFSWYTRRFVKWNEIKKCRWCTATCKKENICVFFNTEFEFPEVGENG